MAQAVTKSYPVDFIYLDSPEKITNELIPGLLAIGYTVTTTARRIFDDSDPPVPTDEYAFSLFKITDEDPTGGQSRIETVMGRVVVLDKGRLYETSVEDFLDKNTPSPASAAPKAVTR